MRDKPSEDEIFLRWSKILGVCPCFGDYNCTFNFRYGAKEGLFYLKHCPREIVKACGLEKERRIEEWK